MNAYKHNTHKEITFALIGINTSTSTCVFLCCTVRARPPVNLFTHDAGDGGRQLSWSSPYPPSSSLNQKIMYQLSYRTETQDNWTVSMKHMLPVKIHTETRQEQHVMGIRAVLVPKHNN